MEQLKIQLEELILTNGITDKEVLKVSQLLDNYIVDYYMNDMNLDYRQAV